MPSAMLPNALPQRGLLPSSASRCWSPPAVPRRRGLSRLSPAAVTTLVLQPRTLPVSYEYVGQTAGSKEVEVRARVTGILEKRLFAEGAPVKAGQPLFVIDPKPLEAQAAAAAAEVARARAQHHPAELARSRA